MFYGIMRLITHGLTFLKDAFLGDLDWGVLFIFCIAMTFALKYAYNKLTKQNDIALKQRWLGLGRILYATYAARNWILRAGYVASGVILYMSAVTAGSSMNGALADFSSAMTNTRTGTCQIYANDGMIGGKHILILGRIEINDRGQMEMDSLSIIGARVSDAQIAQGTNLSVGTYVDLSLTGGTTWISGLSQDQAFAMTSREHDRWYNRIGRLKDRAGTAFASLF